jgi:hypothetical protein
VSEAQCDVPCPGNSSQRCGGSWRYQLYNVSRPDGKLTAGAGAGPIAGVAAAGASSWFVDPIKGLDSNSGTRAKPFESIRAALAASRGQQGQQRTIQLRAGVFFDTALEFGAADAGLTLASYDGPGQALLTGGTKLTGKWTPMMPAEQQQLFPAASDPLDGSTVVKMSLASLLPPGATVEGLQLLDLSMTSAAGAGAAPTLSRATRARYPNVQSIETNLFPDGWIQHGGVHCKSDTFSFMCTRCFRYNGRPTNENVSLSGVGKTFNGHSTVRFKNFSRTRDTPLHGDPELGWRGSYQDYWLGVGGECGNQFEPPEACSCAGAEVWSDNQTWVCTSCDCTLTLSLFGSATTQHTTAMNKLNGGLTHIGMPPKGATGSVVPAALLPNSKHYKSNWWKGAVVHGFPTRWYTSQFEINGSTASANGHLSMTFGRGGVGGNAAADSCGSVSAD